MKKKITYFYIISFILIFIISFSLDFIYKKNVVNLTVGSHYQVSVKQLSDIKENLLNNILKETFQNKEFKNNSFKIEKIDIQKINPSTQSIYSILNFKLILQKKVGEKKLEEAINKSYSNYMYKMINELNNNQTRFNYEYVRKNYLKKRTKKIEKKYDLLVKSDFFKNYQPQQCSKNKVECFEIYTNYFNFIYQYLIKDLNNSNLKILERIKQKNNQNQSVLNIFEDFNSNQILFENSEFFLEQKKINVENEYMSKKFYELINSEFYLHYASSPSNSCYNYSKECFQRLSNEFSRNLILSNLDTKEKFTVFLIKETNKKFKIYNDIPIIIGISIILNYILFAFTYKLLRRKLK